MKIRKAGMSWNISGLGPYQRRGMPVYRYAVLATWPTVIELTPARRARLCSSPVRMMPY